MRNWFRRKSTAVATDRQWEEISAEVLAARKRRNELLVGKGSLVRELESLLFQHDPIGIAVGNNTDEYSAEAESIALGLPDAQSEDDVRRLTHGVFVRWFDPTMAGSEARYEHLSHEIWRVWRESQP